MGIAGLGKDFDVVAVANGVFLNLRDYEAVTFIGVRAGGDTFTVQEATDAAATGAQNLAAFDHTYSQVDGDGTDTWTRNDEGGAVAVADAQGTDAAVAIHISANSLSDGFTHVNCNGPGVTPSSIVVAVLHSLAVQRDPSNLPAVSA